MCQKQPQYYNQIDSQINLLFQLIVQIREQLQALMVKKVDKILYNLAFQKIQQIESLIAQFEHFDIHEDQQSSAFQTIYNYRDYTQIIGIGQFSDQQLSNSSSQKIDLQTSKSYTNSPFKCQTSIRGPYRRYLIHQKLRVIDLRNKGKSYTYISRLLKIPQKNIVRWCKYGVKRKQGAGRKIGDIQMQKNVLKWLEEVYNQGDTISSKDIRSKARQYSTKIDFKSSKGWLKNFLIRYQIGKKYDIV